MHLAEMLMTFQNTKGFWSVAKLIHDKGPEIGFSELASGRILTMLGIDFYFKKPILQKGSDFDLVINIGGYLICGETKCKIEPTNISLKSVINSINRAKSTNLPPDQPGLVFLHLPQSWLNNLSNFDEVGKAVQDYIVSSERLIGVIINSSTIIQEDFLVLPIIVSRFISNKRSRYFKPQFDILDGALDVSRWPIDLVKVWGPQIWGDDFPKLLAKHEADLRRLTTG